MHIFAALRFLVLGIPINPDLDLEPGLAETHPNCPDRGAMDDCYQGVTYARTAPAAST